MSIDKRINYQWGGPGGKSPGTSASGGSRGGGGGPPGGGDRQMTYSAPAPSRGPAAPPSILSRPTLPKTETVPGDETFKPKKTTMPSRNIHVDTEETKEEQRQLDIQQMIADQQEEKYGVTADPTKLGETIDKRTQKEKDEDWERAQDWDLIKDLSKKGYDFDEIQEAAEKGLTVKAPTTSARRQNLIDTGLASIRNIVPETGLERSLLSRMKSFVPGAKAGLGSLTDKMGSLGQYFNPQKMIMNFALSKMGLGFLNPLMGLASLFGFNPFKNMGTSYAGVPYKKGPTVSDDDPSKPQDIVTESIKKFQPTDKQTAQINEIMRKRMILQGYADKGSLNERGVSTLKQMNQMISQYQADPRSIYG